MDSIKRYRDFGDFLREKLPCKVQKISINAGFSCPNRDGSKGFGGCTYCNNQTFNPAYCQPQKSITQQLQEGVRFFARKYPEMQYIAYFQAYTNTYDELPALIDRYEEALAYPGVVGLIIGTRPDCMPDALLDYLASLSREKFVLIEYGLESTLDRTLMRINRGHTSRSHASRFRRHAPAHGSPPPSGGRSPYIRIAGRKPRRDAPSCRPHLPASYPYAEIAPATTHPPHTHGAGVCPAS